MDPVPIPIREVLIPVLPSLILSVTLRGWVGSAAAAPAAASAPAATAARSTNSLRFICDMVMLLGLGSARGSSPRRVYADSSPGLSLPCQEESPALESAGQTNRSEFGCNQRTATRCTARAATA